MNLLILSAILTAPPQAPVPPQGPPVDEARVRQIVRDELKSLLPALEAQPRPPAAPAPAAVPAAPAVSYRASSLPPRVNAAGAVTDPAPAGKVWVKAGLLDSDAPWELRDAAPVSVTPAFATPVRSAVYQMFAPRTCAGGNCPR